MDERVFYINLECALLEQAEALQLSNADLTEKVLGFLKYSAEKNCTVAQINYAFILFFGVRVKPDRARALELLLDAAEKKNMFAAYVIAWHYIDSDRPLAFKHMLVAAQHGHPRALLHCADMYVKGTGVERNVLNAMALLRMAVACDHQIVESMDSACNVRTAMFKLAQLILDCDEVDKAEALQLFKRADELGHHEAGIKMAKMLMTGKDVKKDAEAALDIHRRLIKSKKCLMSLRIVAQCLCLGEGCAKDLKAAFALYKEGADVSGDPTCMLCVAYAYQNGYGTGVDWAQAVEYYAKAAKKGALDAMFELAEMYRDEKYGLVNYKLAIDWYLAAAKEGHANSKKAMGDMHRDGLGVPKSEGLSQRWYKTVVL
jgi:TPR repeat protein